MNYLVFYSLIYLLSVYSSINDALHSKDAVLNKANIDKRTLVTTKWSLIQGKIESIIDNRKIRLFLGIPFAKPPVGRLRYKKALPIKHSHKGVYHALNYSSQCLQSKIYADNYLAISEDCLYLNIYTPFEASPDRLYPVFFYVHGSGFAFGSAARQTERGDILASLGDIVVVAPNHRLGLLGQAYGGSNDMPGNLMSKDILRALEWTHENIANFGGNPNEVTLGGMSAGSVLASLVALSPSTSYGLFKRCFFMSGVAIGPYMVWPAEKEMSNSKKLAHKVGCVKKARIDDGEALNVRELRCMRLIDGNKIIRALGLQRPYPMYGDSLMPISMDKMLKMITPISSYSMMIGLEEIEDLFSIGFKASSKKEAYFFLQNQLMSNTLNGSIEELYSILDDYFTSIDDDDQIKIAHTVRVVISHASFHCSSVLFMEKLAAKNKIYFYYNHYPLASVDKKLTKNYAAHADDAHFLLGQPLRADYVHKYNSTDRYVSLKLINIFSQFIKSGQTFWPAISRQKDNIQLNRWNINAQVDNRFVDEYNIHELCKRWNSFLGLAV